MKKAFTIIAVILLCIAVLFGIMLKRELNDAEAREQMHNVWYYLSQNITPENDYLTQINHEQILELLRSQDKAWFFKHDPDKKLLDYWGTPLKVGITRKDNIITFLCVTAGRDGEFSTRDDMTNMRQITLDHETGKGKSIKSKWYTGAE